MVNPTETQATDHPELDLKNPALAGFLAWLIPGLGHLYQGRYGKAALYFVCIMGTFLFGMYLGGGRVVYLRWEPGNKQLYFLCQVGVGLPALPAIVEWDRERSGDEPWFKRMAPPSVDELNGLKRDLGRYFEFGTVYTAVAGLLNVLAVYDAAAGPVWARPGKEDDDEEDDEKSSDES